MSWRAAWNTFSTAVSASRAPSGAEVDAGGEGIDHRDLVLAGELHDAELGPIGPLAHELGVDGDEALRTQAFAEGVKFGGCVTREGGGNSGRALRGIGDSTRGNRDMKSRRRKPGAADGGCALDTCVGGGLFDRLFWFTPGTSHACLSDPYMRRPARRQCRPDCSPLGLGAQQTGPWRTAVRRPARPLRADADRMCSGIAGPRDGRPGAGRERDHGDRDRGAARAGNSEPEACDRGDRAASGRGGHSVGS